MSDSTSLIVLTKTNQVRTLTIPDDTAYVTQYMNAIFAAIISYGKKTDRRDGATESSETGVGVKEYHAC